MNTIKRFSRNGTLGLLTQMFCGMTLLTAQFTVDTASFQTTVNSIGGLCARLNQSLITSISIVGEDDINASGVYTYTIIYSGVMTDTGAIRYAKPAPNMTPLNEQRDQWVEIVSMTPEPSGAWNPGYVWNYAAVGYTGQIEVVVRYGSGDLCPAGVFQHFADITDVFVDLSSHFSFR